MAQKLTAGMPAAVELDGNYTLRLTALDPATGAVVAGVTVSAFTIFVVDLTANLLSTPGYTVTPLLTFTPGTT